MAGKSAGSGSTASQAIISIVESAANTLTFKRLESGLAPLEKVGWILHKILWRLNSGDFALFNGTTDTLELGLVMSNSLTTVSDADPAVISRKVLIRTDLGTAASGNFYNTEMETDFSTLPGGGILILPNPLYGSIQGTGLSGAAGAVIRLFFSPVEMSSDDYFNLVQSRQILVNS